jgi:hypothetical protein
MLGKISCQYIDFEELAPLNVKFLLVEGKSSGL